MTKSTETTGNGSYKLLATVQQKVIAVLIGIVGTLISAVVVLFLVGIRADMQDVRTDLKANTDAQAALKEDIAELDKKVDLGFKDVSAVMDDVEEVTVEFKQITKRIRDLELGR